MQGLEESPGDRFCTGASDLSTLSGQAVECDTYSQNVAYTCMHMPAHFLSRIAARRLRAIEGGAPGSLVVFLAHRQHPPAGQARGVKVASHASNHSRGAVRDQMFSSAQLMSYYLNTFDESGAKCKEIAPKALTGVFLGDFQLATKCC